MAITKIITDLPTPPQSTDPINFAVRADAFVASLDVLQGDINEWATQANTTQTQINTTQDDVEELKQDVIDLKDDVIVLKSETNDIKNEAQTFLYGSMLATNFKGVFVVGTTNALLGEMWSYDNTMWLCLQNTSETPDISSTKWMLNNIGTLVDFTTALDS